MRPLRTRPAVRLGLLLLLLAALPLRAQDDAVRHGTGPYPFEETVLDNGLRVISLEDHSTPIVAVQLWYHVGSKDERPDRQGFAHMFEHMMFRGTDHLGPKDHFEYIRRTGGQANAYTSFDQTVYVQEVPANQLDMVLWLEAERMARLKIDEGGFATERKVVEEERRLGLNQPYGMVFEKVLAALFTKHPYRWSPIGQIEDLRAATAQELQGFWDTYYVPNNATLVVVGDITHEQVRASARHFFGWIPRCPDPPRVTVREPPPNALRRVEIEEENGPAPIAGIAFMAVPEGHPDSVALDMLMRVLGGGESSRVYIDMVRRKEVAAFAGAGLVQFEQAGLALVGGVTMPFGQVDPIVSTAWEAIDKVKREGVTGEELEKVRTEIRRDHVTESLTVASKASALGQAAVIGGDAELANTYLDRVAEVTRLDLQRVARTYLVKDRATEIRIEPTLGGMFSSVFSMAAGLGEKPEENLDTEPDEVVEGGERARAGGPKASAERPEDFGATPPVAPPLDVDVDLAGQDAILDNGLHVVVVENHEVPFVTMSLRLKAGAFTEDPAHPGTAAMAASLVTKGTFARDAEALAAELEQHAISLSAEAGHDSASVSVSCITDEADRALRLLAEVVQVPAFDKDEFRTLRDQTATGMAIAEKQPATIADRAFEAALWGEDHPYGHPAEGTSDDLQRLSPERLADWWQTWVRPGTATLYVAGDVTPDDAVALADRYLGDWEGEGETPHRPLPPLSAPDELRIKLVDRPGAVQSQIRAGHEGITRANAHYATGQVLTQVFGGAFNSRLNDVIRVQKGLTYGARGGLSSRRFGGEFEVSTFTKTPTTAETVQAVIDEVQRMRDEPPSAQELDDAVSYLAGSFAGSLETPQAVVGRLWTLELNDLPSDYWSSYLKRIATTTSEAVARAAADLLHPQRLIVVVVGSAEDVQDDLEEIAPVDLVTTGG